MSFRATSMPITPRISWFWEQRPGSAMGSVPPPAPKASLCSRKRPHPCPVRSADLPTAPSSPGCSGHAGPRACLVLPQWGAHLLLPGTILRQVEYWERPCHHQPQPLQGEGEDRVVFMASHTPLQVLRAGVQGQATFLAPLFELPPPPGAGAGAAPCGCTRGERSPAPPFLAQGLYQRVLVHVGPLHLLGLLARQHHGPAEDV